MDNTAILSLPRHSVRNNVERINLVLLENFDTNMRDISSPILKNPGKGSTYLTP